MPSDGENGAPPVVLPLDLVAAGRGTSMARRGMENWLAVVEAALLHALVLLWLLLDWRLAAPPPEPEAVPVRLVMVPPAPVAPPVPAPEPKPQYRESGKDQQTTAPPAAEATGPEATAPPPAPAELPSAERAVPEQQKPKPREEARRTPPLKKAETARAPRPDAEHRVALEPAERAQSGDPYLNRLFTLIERHRVYPRVVGQFGLPIEGVASYRITLDRSGNLTEIALVGSSGAAALDKAGEGMIRDAAPFPPVPAEFPGAAIHLTVVVPLFSDRP